ncbi:MAG: Crp/Fnr family transcriptional regulator [Janthinobacterium lividum]
MQDPAIGGVGCGERIHNAKECHTGTPHDMEKSHLPDHSAKPLPFRPSTVASSFDRRAIGPAGMLSTLPEQSVLARIAKLVRIPAHTVIYRQDDNATAIYSIFSGAVATYEMLSDGNRCVTAFLFPNDLVGLTGNGRYASSAATLEATVAYQIPIDALRDVLSANAGLGIGFLIKVCHTLRNAQHHAITLSENSAGARIAGFLLWLRNALHQAGNAAGSTAGSTANSAPEHTTEIALPMARQDIADYLGLSVESISRALHVLETQGLIQRVGPRIIRLLDPERLAVSSHQR